MAIRGLFKSSTRDGVFTLSLDTTSPSCISLSFASFSIVGPFGSLLIALMGLETGPCKVFSDPLCEFTGLHWGGLRSPVLGPVMFELTGFHEPGSGLITLRPVRLAGETDLVRLALFDWLFLMLVFVLVRCLSEDVVRYWEVVNGISEILEIWPPIGFSLIPLVGSRITIFEFSTHDNKNSLENDFFLSGGRAEPEWFGRESKEMSVE
jgi:hypothetical protein